MEANNPIENYTFDKFPSSEMIIALPNNTFFTTRGFYSKDDGFGCTYYATTNWQPSALRFGEKYVIPTSQPKGEVFLPYYGIRTGADYAVSNSNVLSSISGIAFASLLKLPAGHFYFDRPISLSEKQLKLQGVAHVGYTVDLNTNGLTWMHFPNLSNGQSAISCHMSTISNIIFYGNPKMYDCRIDRTKTVTDPDHIIKETNTGVTYGIKTTQYCDIQDCGFRFFYYGIYCDASNTTINNIFGRNCHTVVSIGNDVKVSKIFGSDSMCVLQTRGSIASATTVRGDSIGDHLIHVAGGSGIYLSDIDADYCLKSIIHIGDGNWATINTLFVDGMHGRSNTYRAYDTTVKAEPTVADITTSSHVKEYPIISVEKQTTLKSAKFILQGRGNANPMDASSNYLTPSIILAADKDTTVRDINITIIGSNLASGDEEPMSAAWVSKRVKSLSTYARNLEVSIESAFDKIIYKRSGSSIKYSKVVTEEVKV